MIKVFIIFFSLFSFQSFSQFGGSFASNMSEAYLEEAMKKNPFEGKSEEEMREILKERSDGTFMQNLLSKSPKFEDFAVKWLIDPDAMPKLFSIIKKKKKLKKFSAFALFLIIAGFFVGGLLTKEDRSMTKIFFKKLAIRMGFLGISLVMFYFAFKPELEPSFMIFKDSFF